MNKFDKKLKNGLDKWFQTTFAEITAERKNIDSKMPLIIKALLFLILSPLLGVAITIFTASSAICNIFISLIIPYIKYKERLERKNILKTIKYDLEKHAENLHKYDKYYHLGDDFVDEGRALSNFIYNFILDFNYKYYTYDLNNYTICAPGKRRSLGDIYLICKYYYPDCTIEEVLKILIKHLKNNTTDIKGSYCYDIQKYVFTSSRSSDHIVLRVQTEYSNLQFIDFYNNL